MMGKEKSKFQQPTSRKDPSSKIQAPEKFQKSSTNADFTEAPPV
jgi:hypothetical protein